MRPGSARPGSARARPSSARQRATAAGGVEGSGGTAVKVAVRIRPFNASDGSDSVTAVERSPADPKSVVVEDHAKRSELRQFNFDHVFTDGQQEVFDNIGVPMLEEAYQGFNVCLFAYGQTGSGKTHSIQGDDTEEGAGVVPRFVQAMFDRAQQKVDEDSELSVKITMSYIEIYMEKVRDLLTPNPKPGAERESLEIREDAQKRTYVKDLGVHSVLGTARVNQLLEFGNANRQRAETKMNEFSSRSHSIIQFTISQSFDAPERRDIESVVWLVDLAGSERQGKAEATGLQLEEAKKINHSLLMLGRALNTLSEGKNDFLSLRESKLTRLLSECLGGNSKTWMLATVAPSQYNLSETISTLEYATNAKRITNRAVVNKKARQLEIKELKDVTTRLELALESERDSVEELEKTQKRLQADLQELRAVREKQQAAQAGYSSNNGSPREGGNNITETPIAQLQHHLANQRLDNQELRNRIATIKKKLKTIEESPAGASNGKPKFSAFVGRCGLTLSDILLNKDPARMWRLKAVDTNHPNSNAVVLLQAYHVPEPQDHLQLPLVPAQPYTDINDALGAKIYVYINIVGAEGIPEQYTRSVFAKLSAINQKFSTPSQTSMQQNTPNPKWGLEGVYALPVLQQALIDRYSRYNLFSLEVFGMP